MLKIFGDVRLTKDVEVKTTQTGKKVANASIANNRGTGDNRQTDFIDLIGWENLADAMEGLKKGDLVNISGSFQTRSWKDKNGVERKNEEIVLDSISLANVKKKDEEDAPKPAQKAKTNPKAVKPAPIEESKDDADENDIFQAIDDDDIPF